MELSGENEKFGIHYDSSGGRVRLAMIGSKGSEILILMPLERMVDSDDLSLQILRYGEETLRAALMALIRERWPSDSD